MPEQPESTLDPNARAGHAARRKWVRPLVITVSVLTALVGGPLAFDRIFGDAIVNHIVAENRAADAKVNLRQERLEAKYDADIQIVDMEVWESDRLGYGSGGIVVLPGGVRVQRTFVIDGIPRECTMTSENTDPTITCVGYVIPLEN